MRDFRSVGMRPEHALTLAQGMAAACADPSSAWQLAYQSGNLTPTVLAPDPAERPAAVDPWLPDWAIAVASYRQMRLRGQRVTHSDGSDSDSRV